MPSVTRATGSSSTRSTAILQHTVPPSLPAAAAELLLWVPCWPAWYSALCAGSTDIERGLRCPENRSRAAQGGSHAWSVIRVVVQVRHGCRQSVAVVIVRVIVIFRVRVNRYALQGICQPHQSPKYKLLGVKRSYQPVKDLRVVSTCNCRRRCSCRRALPSTGVSVVDDRRVRPLASTIRSAIARV
jgi:hypothetical protein